MYAAQSVFILKFHYFTSLFFNFYVYLRRNNFKKFLYRISCTLQFWNFDLYFRTRVFHL